MALVVNDDLHFFLDQLILFFGQQIVVYDDHSNVAQEIFAWKKKIFFGSITFMSGNNIIQSYWKPDMMN